METLIRNEKTINFERIVRKGDIFWCRTDGSEGSEQGGGMRPVIVIQNNIGNKFSSVTIVAMITSRINKAKLPTHVEIKAKDTELTKDSVILLEQVRSIDKNCRLGDYIGSVDEITLEKINRGLMISFGIDVPTNNRSNKGLAQG